MKLKMLMSETEQTANEPKVIPMHAMRFRIWRRTERIYPDGSVTFIADTLYFDFTPHPLIQAALLRLLNNEATVMGIFFGGCSLLFKAI
jgi:hypothetical protein